MKFNVGDRVKITGPSTFPHIIGMEGKIFNIDQYDIITIQFDNSGSWSCMAEDLELIPPILPTGIGPNWYEGSAIDELIVPKCTCGAHKTYGVDSEHHSSWCDLWKK